MEPIHSVWFCEASCEVDAGGCGFFRQLGSEVLMTVMFHSSCCCEMGAGIYFAIAREVFADLFGAKVNPYYYLNEIHTTSPLVLGYSDCEFTFGPGR